LAFLANQGVGQPKSLQVTEVPEGLVQQTVAEPPGQITLQGSPANILMFNVSPVQGLRQTREGRSFKSDMLQGDMTLMPAGVPSRWSWNSFCDRLDVIVSPEMFGASSKLEVVDRFLFRDSEMEAVCRRLNRELSLGDAADQLFVEVMVVKLAVLLRERHSSASRPPPRLASSGLTRNQARRVLDYIESDLGRHLTLVELAGVAGLSLHHFAHMFKRTLGLSPHQYVLERRVERAKTLMRETHASLAEISLETGFSSQSHFTSAFCRLAGATPTQFRCCWRPHRS
jgi:AraC family transcriptional regulator